MPAAEERRPESWLTGMEAQFAAVDGSSDMTWECGEFARVVVFARAHLKRRFRVGFKGLFFPRGSNPVCDLLTKVLGILRLQLPKHGLRRLLLRLRCLLSVDWFFAGGLARI